MASKCRLQDIWFGWPSAHNYEAIDEIRYKDDIPILNILGTSARRLRKGWKFPEWFSFQVVEELRRHQPRRNKPGALRLSFTGFSGSGSRDATL